MPASNILALNVVLPKVYKKTAPLKIGGTAAPADAEGPVIALRVNCQLRLILELQLPANIRPSFPDFCDP